MSAPHQNWQALAAGGFQDANASGTGSVVSRDFLDRLRMAQAGNNMNIPTGSYPDGYLGTIRSRQDDRLLDSVKNRENQRAYQRGVHKGERIDPAQYIWPPEMDPVRGLRNQARGGNRNVPLVELVDPPHLVNDGKAGPSVVGNEPGVIDPFRASQLSSLRPPWR
jgi:hypothetical protein